MPRPRTILVDQRPEGDASKLHPLPEEMNRHLEIVDQTRDLAAARRRLVSGDADVVAVLPPDPMDAVRRGEHAGIHVLTNEIDPVRRSYARSYLNDQIASLNQQTVQKAIVDAQASLTETRELTGQARGYLQTLRSVEGDVARARTQVRELKQVVDPLARASAQASSAVQGASFVLPGFAQPSDQLRRLANAVDDLKRNVDQLDARLSTTGPNAVLPSSAELASIEEDLAEIERTVDEVGAIPPEVLAAPFQLDLENVAPAVPSYTSYYAPAALALLIQHLAVTLGALSMARVRLLGMMELLRVAPARPSEVVTGNYLAYAMVCAVASAALIALLVWGIGVPVFGSWLHVAGILGLLIFVSLGAGFVISMISSSEQQAAQIAMLVLIASIFFGGFIVALEAIMQPVRALSYLLPATYAIRLLQDVMLRGVLRSQIDMGVLGAAGLMLFAVTVQLMRREYRPR
jgi:ABC-2 type transport system permease protein